MKQMPHPCSQKTVCLVGFCQEQGVDTLFFGKTFPSNKTSRGRGENSIFLVLTFVRLEEKNKRLMNQQFPVRC